MVEIIGEDLGEFLRKFEIEAKLTYSGNNGFWLPLQVWALTEDSYTRLCNVTESLEDEFWDKEFPNTWWRHAEGSNQGSPNFEFTINRNKINAWLPEYNFELYQEEFDELADNLKACYDNDIYKYIENWYSKYHDICEYLCEVMEASTEKNVCALVTDLAKYNNITISELFRKYGGSKANIGLNKFEI